MMVWFSCQVEWMDNNNRIVNPRKFKAVVLSEDNIETVGTKFQIREKVIYSSNKGDLLGVAVDDQLLDAICQRFVAKQLDNLTLSNAQGRISPYKFLVLCLSVRVEIHKPIN